LTPDRTTLAEIIARHIGREGPLLPILHDVQAAFGCIGEDAKRGIAEALNISRAEVHGAVSFYHDFSSEAAKLPVIKLCRAEACQARGCEDLAANADALAAGRVKVEPVYCLGLCSVGPNVMIGDAVYARVDAARFAALIGGL